MTGGAIETTGQDVDGGVGLDEDDAFDDGDELDDEADDEAPELEAVWYRLPVWRLWLFTLLGGWLYQVHYIYCAWCAYRASMGYSRQLEWRAVHRRTGFRVSPFWRALVSVYSYALLVVIWREARLCGVRRVGWPGLWSVAHWASVVLLAWSPKWWLTLPFLSVVFLPAQATINALADQQQGDRRREPVTGSEVIILLLGAALTAWSFTQGARP